MKIGIDVHGVIDKAPGLMVAVMDMLRDMGHEICIISGPSRKQIEEELFAMNIFMPGGIMVYSVVDYLRGSGVKMWQDDKGDWWSSDEEWWASKGNICREHGVDMLMDDSEKYAPGMPDTTRFYLVRKDVKKHA